MHDPKLASVQARNDWDTQTCRTLGIGYLATDRPLLNPNTGFDNASVGDAFPDAAAYAAAQEFCRIYNETVAELVAEHGLPDWAPAQRKPDRKRILKLISGNLHPRSELEAVINVRRHRVSALIDWAWNATTPPIAFAHLPDIELSFLAGDVSPRCGQVNVYDSRRRHANLLASEQYRRRHFPDLPWDHLTD